MKLYLAGDDGGGYYTYLEGLTGFGFLLSYWYIVNAAGWQTYQWAQERNIPLFLDSGAFSAMTKGEPIDLDAYITFCRQYQSTFAVVASLDVIGDAEASAINHDKMRQAGINSIPCFHVNERWEHLERMLESEPYIALGVAGNQSMREKVYAWLTRCFLMNRENGNKTRFHGFGLTSYRVMAWYPWYSVDSTGWFVARRFGKQLVKQRKGWKGIRAPGFPRKATKEDYAPLLRHNAEVMLQVLAEINESRGL